MPLETPKPLKKHYMPRGWEMFLGFAFALIGIWLLWEAYDNRGGKAPWPLSAFLPY